MKEPLRVPPEIKRKMDRGVHCGLSILKAVRETVKLFGGYPICKDIICKGCKKHRRYFFAAIILAHMRNYVEYKNVMRGTTRPWIKCPNPYVFDTKTKQTNRKKQQ